MKSEKIKINVNVYRAFKITIRITIPKLSWELPLKKNKQYICDKHAINIKQTERPQWLPKFSPIINIARILPTSNPF